jgi:hypothetical protein
MAGLELCKEKSMSLVKSEIRVLLSLGLLLPALAQAADVPPPAAPDAQMNMAQPAEGTSSGQREALPPEGRTSMGMETPVPANVQQQPMETMAGMGPSIAPESLDQYRGGSSVSVNSIKSEAVSNGLLQDATATNVATGNNIIADGAFSNAYGLPIVIQNSGANVLIQNSTIVNVQFR